MNSRTLFLVLFILSAAYSQNKDAFTTSDEKKGGGLFDPSRFSIHHSLSFGAMSSSGVSNLQSQSLYTTMMQYQFTAPVTLNLNFGLPIHSTLSSAENLTAGNLQSLDYFKSMPMEMSLSWQPTQNTLLQFNIVKAPAGSYFYNNYWNDGWYARNRYHNYP